MPTLLHLNGPPGVGKSTITRAYASAKPGTLVCDIDERRTWVSGWEDDFVGTGEAVRSAALALITAYLADGHDVVLPQLIMTADQVERFETAAADAGAEYVAVVLDLAPETLLDRLHSRALTPLTAVISRIIEEQGGDDEVLRLRRRLLALAADRGHLVVDASDQGEALSSLN